MNFSFCFTITCILLGSVAAAAIKDPNCCYKKTVGSESYTLLENITGAVPAECINSCIYERDQQPGSQFCFKMGNLPVKCRRYLEIHNTYLEFNFLGQITINILGTNPGITPPPTFFVDYSVGPGGTYWHQLFIQNSIKYITATSETIILGECTSYPSFGSSPSPSDYRFEIVPFPPNTMTCKVLMK